ncbi:molybdate ABC transporter permease subunit [Marinobacter sp. AN1]|uniref:molybdate ABC transporter permease subunit n=1 Tax=Marinobacter sp. AN1 TaxID=2886046 RepID=UPI0022316334|nr:molybdate ABC transporter permease subunit [Marinobacter sp. AN1]UZD65976.1 molybdate ABC transporter permease subunit [Marinobacter sp. AN1]
MPELSPQDWQAIAVTLKLCALTTAILLVLATPLAWWLAHRQSPSRTVVQALVALPLVLPPTVLGFYLLIALGPRGPVGQALEAMGLTHLAFSFEGILVASVIYSLPFAVQPLVEAFRHLGTRPVEVAASLGAGPLDRLFTVILPLCRGGFIVAATLTFAHTLGEFGVILMLGGSIPGETQVLSVLIYDYAEAMDYAAAHRLSLGLLIFAFVVLVAVYSFNRRFDGVRP